MAAGWFGAPGRITGCGAIGGAAATGGDNIFPHKAHMRTSSPFFSPQFGHTIGISDPFTELEKLIFS